MMNCSYYEQVTDAYLCGDIETAEWRAHLERCPSCAAKLRSESDFDLVIKHAVNEERLQTRQLEAHVRAAIRQPSRWRSPMLLVMRYGVAAMVVFGALVITTFGYAKGRIDRSAVCVDAVDDHQEEIVGKAPRKWRSDATEVAALSQKMTGDPTVPERIAPAGYHLIGARICLLHGKRYMHLDYSDGSKEISLFVRHHDSDMNVASRVLHWFEPKSTVADRIDTFAVASLEKHDLAVVLVSASPTSEVRKIVTDAAKQL
jgi:anti-sigma factor RsiW